MFSCCTINIGWLTSLVDSFVNIFMSLVSHGSSNIHFVHLIFLLRLSVDMDDILVLCMIDCCMTCDAPKPGGPLTTRQPAEYKWRSGYPTPL